MIFLPPKQKFYVHFTVKITESRQDGLKKRYPGSEFDPGVSRAKKRESGCSATSTQALLRVHTHADKCKNYFKNINNYYEQ